MAGGSCPVGPAWQALVNAVGEYEAMKDFMENNETVRTPEEVLDKLRLQKELPGKKFEVKPGVAELFDSNPELAAIGTQEQYSQYLDSIFPNSQVKDILYHGTPEGQFEKFDITKAGKVTGTSTKGIYFTDSKRTADFYAEGSIDLTQFESLEEYEAVTLAKVFSVIINAEQLKLVANPQGQKKEGDVVLRTKNKLSDIGLTGYTPDLAHQYIVFNPEQIHILGSKNDIEGFKEFVDNYSYVPFYREQTVFNDTYYEYIPYRENKLNGYDTDRLAVIAEVLDETSNEELYNLIKSELATSDKYKDDSKFLSSRDFYSWLGDIKVKGIRKDIEAYKQGDRFKGKDVLSSITNTAFSDYINLLLKLRKDPVSFYREQTVLDVDNDIIQDQGAVPMQPTQQNQTRAREIVSKLMDNLSEALGISYQIITGAEAKEITKSSMVPWNGEKGFYFNGVAYFVADNLTTEVVFHEFSHPFVEAIRRSNPELYNNIYSKLLNSPEGRSIESLVKSLYPELDTETDAFKDEVITMSLGKLADDKFKKQGNSKSFIDGVKDFMYWVKQQLRKVFGKISISKLDVNTNLNELADMLVSGKKFNITTDIVKSKDAARYLKDMRKEIADMAMLQDEDLVELATQGFKAVINTLENMKDRKNYLEMLEVFKDEFGLSNFQQIKENLSQYTKQLDEKTSDLIDKVKYTQDHVESLVNTFARLSKTIHKIAQHLPNLSKDKDNPENIAKAHSYAKTLDFWGSFISFSLETFEKNGLSNQNEIYKLVAGINEEITRANKEISLINGEGIKAVLLTRLAPISDSIIERMNSMLKTYDKYGSPQSMRDRLFVEVYGMKEAEFKEYEDLKAKGQTMSGRYQTLNQKLMTGAFISEEKIELLLKGELNDVSWANSYMEGYLYNDDYVVGGFSLFVKDAIDQVYVRAQSNYNDFAKELHPLLEENGYNPNNIGELGKRVGFVDNILVYDRDTGKYEKKEVWTFLNKFKNYRYERDLLEQNIKEARENYRMSNTKEDEQNLSTAINAKIQHDINYMHQEYVPEYYERRNNFTNYGNDMLAVEALVKRDELLRSIRNLQQQGHGEKGLLDISKQIDEKWNEYNMLHSIYDVNGKLKKDSYLVKDNDTGKEMEVITNDLSIARKLNEFRDQMSKFTNYVLIEGAFENALRRYEQELLNQNITGDDFLRLRRDWINRNTRVVIKKEFWEERKRLMTRMKELLSKLPRPTQSVEKMDEAFKNINDAIVGFRDEDGQPNGTALSPGRVALVKESQEIINEIRENLPGMYGLSKKEMNELKTLEEIEAYGFTELTSDQIRRIGVLKEQQKKNLQNFTPAMRAELLGLFNDLTELQSNEPTEYYLSQLNNLIESIDDQSIQDQLKFTFGPDKLDADAAKNLLNIGPADKYRNMLVKLMENSDFRDWFEKNHVQTVRYNKTEERDEVIYDRLRTWNVIRPNDPAYYERHSIKNYKGEDEMMPGLPSRRFYKREVKDEYMTGYDKNTKQVKLIVGVHVDNKNRWLPREDVFDNPYLNKDYYDMRDNDPKLFKLLEKMKEKHLEFQEGLDNGSKLYLDFPRFAKSNLELLQSKKDKKVDGNWLRLLIRRIKEFFKGSKEEPESGHNWSDDYKVATLDIFDKDEYSIPIRGLYDINIDDVSTDITSSMLRYMFSAEENKRLTEIHPVATALRQTLQTNGAENFRKMLKRNMTTNGEFGYRNKDMNRVRREVVNNFIERTFYGQANKGPFQDNAFIQNLSQGIFQMASLGFFAFNIPSALKNQLGAKIQNLIEGAAGTHFNLKDLTKAEIWSNATMGEVSMQIYKKTPKSANVQLWEIFDPVFSFEQKPRREGMSRTFLKDLTEPTGLTMNFRKWTEMQASMQLFAAMLYNKKVKMGDKTISLIDAWEVVDGRIQLKNGVDPEWGITYDADGNQHIGKKFLETKNKIQAVHRSLQGAYDEFNQPEMQRYLAARYVTFLRRYFTTMLIDRVGFKYKNGQVQPRFNPGLGTMNEGFYVTLLKYLGDIFRHGPKRLVYATPEERRAILKTLMDAAVLTLLTLAISLLFGWDGDDEERYEKLRQKSGPLRLFPFVAEDEYEFHLKGWLSNHMLGLIMQMRSEQNQFIPFPGMGLDDYKEMITEVGSSAAFGPTLSSGFLLIQDLYWMNPISPSEKAWYQREVGPYTWQQEGGSKFLNHLAKMMSFTGTTIDPAVGIKNFQSVELGFNR